MPFKDRILHEIGQSSLPNRVFEQLKHLSSIERGRALLGSPSNWLQLFNPVHILKLLGTGPTAGAREHLPMFFFLFQNYSNTMGSVHGK
jgi:hypothetical protein